MMKSHPHESLTGSSLVHWVPSSALGGIEMAALTLIQMVPTMRHVVATGDATGPAVSLWREAGAEVVQIEGWRSFLGLTWTSRWKAFVCERGIQRLIAWSPTRLPQLLAPLSADCRCVVHLGNVGRFNYWARWQAKVMAMIHRPACRPRLIACSHAVAASVESEPVFADLPRVVIPNAARSAFFALGSDRPKLLSAPKVWGMLARLDELKDHRSLIEAVRLLPADLGFRLEIIGDGVLREALHRQVAAAGLEQRVIFLGALARPQEAMRHWEAFVFSTTGGEGFGIAAAEAMAAGLPCVLSDVAALREVAGNSAYYARQGSPADICAKMLEVIQRPSEAQTMADEGRRRAQTLYSAEAFARRYLQELGLGQ